MSSHPIGEFAWKELAPLLLTPKARVRFERQCLEYFHFRQIVPDRPPPLPFDTDHEYDIRNNDKPPLNHCERYAILAAIHDNFCHQERPIVATPLPLRAGVAWEAILSHVRSLDESHLPRLRHCLEAVKLDLEAWLANEPLNPAPSDPHSILASLGAEAELRRRQESEDYRIATQRAARLNEQKAWRERLAGAFDSVYRFTNEEVQEGRKPCSDGFRHWAERFIALGSIMHECDKAIEGLCLVERLRTVAQRDAPAAMKYACALLLAASTGRADTVVAALENANSDKELRRFVLWLPFILDNLWTPFPDERGLIPVDLSPDGTSLDENEQAVRAFHWSPVDLSATVNDNAPLQQAARPGLKDASGVVLQQQADHENSLGTVQDQWTAGTFLAKARELSRRLRSWHIEDFRSPVQFASQRESRRWVRLTFREIVRNVSATPTSRPQRGLQLYMHEGGELDEKGCVGEAYENPERDTDRSLTMWLMGDFLLHLDVAPPLPALDYLKESFGQLLDLSAWTIRGPDAEESWPDQHGLDEQGNLRGYMVTGRIVPEEFLQNLTDAAEKLLTSAPVGWMAITKGPYNHQPTGHVGATDEGSRVVQRTSDIRSIVDSAGKGSLSVEDLSRYRLALDRAIRAWGLLAGHVRARLTAAFRSAHGVTLKDGFMGGPDIPRSFSAACEAFREALRELHTLDEAPPDFPWPQWGDRALDLTGPLPDLEGWLHSLQGVAKEHWQQHIIDSFLGHLGAVSRHFARFLERLEQMKEEFIAASENPVATRVRADKAIRKVLVEEHERGEAEQAERRKSLYQLLTAALNAMNPTNVPTEEWARRVAVSLVRVGQEIVAQGWEDWARDSAKDEQLTRGLAEQMFNGDQGQIDAVVRELRDMPSEWSHLIDWLKRLKHDWSRVFDQGWLWWTLTRNLPPSETPQTMVAAGASQDAKAGPSDDRATKQADVPQRNAEPATGAETDAQAGSTGGKIAMPMHINAIRGKVEVGIITVREDEFSAVLKRLPNRSRVTGGHQLYEFDRVTTRNGAELGVAVVRCLDQGHGDAQSVARELIDDLEPPWLFLVGIAGGIPRSEYSLGDVALASRLTDFSVSAAIQGSDPEFSVGGGPMHPEVENLLKHLPASTEEIKGWSKQESIGMKKPAVEIPEDLAASSYYGSEEWRRSVRSSLRANFPNGKRVRAPKFLISPTISSNTLIKDADLAQHWQQSARHTSTVEMELGGVYRAAHRSGQRNHRIVAIRGISDIVGFKRSGEWTTYACHSAAAFAAALLRSGLLQLVRRSHTSR